MKNQKKRYTIRHKRHGWKFWVIDTQQPQLNGSGAVVVTNSETIAKAECARLNLNGVRKPCKTPPPFMG